MLIWDRGIWTPTGDPHKGLAKGHLDFELSGRKLKGRWHLVRMRGKPGEKHENWLLIKGDDEFARADDEPDILEEQPDSAASGREIAEVAKEAPGWSSKTGRIEKVEPRNEKRAGSAKLPDLSTLKGAKKAALPRFVEPMLATLVGTPPSGGRWLHEVKFDGYRIEARIEKGRVALLTRSGLDWTTKFGEALVKAFAGLPVSTALIDGELVVENEAGVSDFSGLQAALSEGRSERLVFYAFDLSASERLRFAERGPDRAQVVARTPLSEATPGRSGIAAISTRTVRWCTGMPAASGLRGSSRSCAIRPIARAEARAGARPNVRPGKSS